MGCLGVIFYQDKTQTNEDGISIVSVKHTHSVVITNHRGYNTVTNFTFTFAKLGAAALLSFSVRCVSLREK